MHLDLATLEQALPQILAAPSDGRIKALFLRPSEGQRSRVESIELNGEDGVVGDNWKHRPGARRPDGSARVETQVTLMNSRVLQLIAGREDRWDLAGDQLIVDLVFRQDELPPGTRLRAGTALLEISEAPHTGCGKFAERYGPDARKFVNTPHGRSLNLRGVNARVVEPGTVRVGDEVTVVR
ncbi:MAG: MOSC domain-containing protein [Verrucomicrobia bacterium]|nr:MOSC domain-containing protein [Verrucomicrobiota bacterium]